MRSLPDARLLGLLLMWGPATLAAPEAALTTAAPASATVAVHATSAPVSREAIQAAVAVLRPDPNLGTERRVRALHWIDGKAPPAAVPPPPWIVGLFDFLGKAGSVFLWVVGGIGLATAAVFIYRLLRAHTPNMKTLKMPVVSHIGEFDIRPTSLPDDVGAAARALLEAGRTREALSLLYRGALSRAVHRFGVRIEESFTEGEALRAVETHLDPTRTEYVGELVRVWQRSVYAGQTASPAALIALCARFAPVLGPGVV